MACSSATPAPACSTSPIPASLLSFNSVPVQCQRYCSDSIRLACDENKCKTRVLRLNKASVQEVQYLHQRRTWHDMLHRWWLCEAAIVTSLSSQGVTTGTLPSQCLTMAFIAQPKVETSTTSACFLQQVVTRLLPDLQRNGAHDCHNRKHVLPVMVPHRLRAVTVLPPGTIATVKAFHASDLTWPSHRS